LSRRLNRKVGASTYVFGYRSDQNFSEMPKICIKVRMDWYGVFDGGSKLSKDAIKIERDKKIIKFYIPLDLIGNPEYILTSARTYFDDVPLDWFSWRGVDLSR